jgi:hypothetical protein
LCVLCGCRASNRYEDYENATNATTPKPQKQQRTAAGKHTIFLSPELQMGNKVHWTYEAYDAEKTPQPPVGTPKRQPLSDRKVNTLAGGNKAPTTPSTSKTGTAKKEFPFSATKTGTATTPKMTFSDQKKFWFSKGSATKSLR